MELEDLSDRILLSVTIKVNKQAVSSSHFITLAIETDDQKHMQTATPVPTEADRQLFGVIVGPYTLPEALAFSPSPPQVHPPQAHI